MSESLMDRKFTKTNSMKNIKMLTLVLTALTFQTLTAAADDLYAMSWHGKAYTTDGSGKIVSRSVSEKDFVNKVAADNGLNAADLVFVYRADKLDTAVVKKSTGEFVADVQQIQYSYTAVDNSANTETVIQSFLFDEDHQDAIGSVFGNIKSKRDSNDNRIGFSFKGSFQYAIPENSTVVSGTFSTGKKVNETF
jgi:hypothetical protein